MRVAIDSPKYAVAPAWHGEIRDFRYYDLESSEQPFAFIVNQRDLLFYVRAKGLRRVAGGFGALKRRFPSASENSRGEWTVRIASKRDADRLNSFLFSGSIASETGRKDPVVKSKILDDAILADPRSDGTASNQFGEARSVLLAILPNKRLRNVVLEQLLESSDAAERIAPSAWGATLYGDAFRLNVGRVEVFILAGDQIRFNLLGKFGKRPFTGSLFEVGQYRSVRGDHVAFVGTTEEFAERRSKLQSAHLEFVRQAATKQSGDPIAGSPHRKSHSEELMAYARGEIARMANPPPLTGQDHGPEAQADREVFARTDITPLQKQTLVNARRGQGLFRDRVIELEGRCLVTGVDLADHLLASHIKPWKVSTDQEKLDGNNGLLLAPHIDYLFDRGYISFTDLGDLIVSPKCPMAVCKAWGIDDTINVGPFRLMQRPYLAHHRAHLLKQ